MKAEKISNELIGKTIILIKHSREVINGIYWGIHRDQLFIEVEGKEVSIALEDVTEVDEVDIEVAEKILTDALEQNTQVEFNQLRGKLFLQYYDAVRLDSMKNFLDIGYPVSDEDGFDHEIEECLTDTQFGLIRCRIRQNETGLSCDALNNAVRTFNENLENNWTECKAKNNRQKGMELLVKAECMGISDSKIKTIAEEYKNLFGEEMRLYIENCNESKLASVVRNPFLMRSYGYTGKEIEKFKRIMASRNYPTGKFDYDKAVRLVTWGFVDEGMKFYGKVAKDGSNAKKDVAVYQLLEYALGKQNYKMFDQYCKYLNPIEKKGDRFRKLQQRELYEMGDYEPLYSIYANDRIIHSRYVTSYVIQGAFLFSMGRETDPRREKLMQDVLNLNNFNGNMWKEAFRRAYTVDADMYQNILWKIMNNNIQVVLEHLEDFYEFLIIDSDFERKIQNSPVADFFSEVYPVVLPCVLYQRSELDDMHCEQYIFNAVKTMNRLLEQMDFDNVKVLGEYFSKKAPDNDDIRRMYNVAQKALNLKDRLPMGQDDYSVGRRLLLLNGDKENAYLHFQNGIENSDDPKEVVLCGTELLRELLGEENYLGVIFWGKKILLDRKILNHSSLVIDLKTAFEKCGDKNEQDNFIEELISHSEEARRKGNYAQVLGFINVIRIFDPGHIYIQENSELLELTKQGKINWEDESFLGVAKRVRYVENDARKYASMLREGIENRDVETSQITDVAVAYLNVCSEEGWDEELFDFIDNMAQYQIPINEYMVTILLKIIEEKRGIQVVILYFTSFLENANEDKKIIFFTRLEQLYEKAILENVEINVKTALEQMLAYIKSGATIQTKYCYDALLIRAGELEMAEEIFALLGSDSQENENASAIIAWIMENHFKDSDFRLTEMFAAIVKDKTLLQLTEHVKNQKNFVVLSSEEKRISNKIHQAISYQLDKKNLIEQQTLIKELYLRPDNRRNWQLYHELHKDTLDQALLYCINVNLSILNPDSLALKDESASAAKQLCQNNTELERRYGGYWFYNELYKLYLNKKYQNNQSVIRRIYTMCQDKHYLKVEDDLELTHKMARDYIDLFHLMDDHIDYIYTKAAMFLATNNRCEKYYYEVFRNDLLMRERVICLKMCIELLMRNKITHDKDLAYQILCDMDAAGTEYKKTVNALKSLCETGTNGEIHAVCSLLHTFPDAPRYTEIQKLDLLNRDRDFSIRVLRIADECLGNSLEIKKLLFHIQCLTGESEYFADLYQENLSIIQMLQDEDQIYDSCCAAVILATALGEKSRYGDIRILYEKQPFNKHYQESLNAFCNAANKIDNDEENSRQFLIALISDNWGKIYEQFDVLESIVESETMRVLLEYKLDVFVKNGAYYLSNALSKKENDDQIRKRKDELERLFQTIFAEPLNDVVDEICALKVSERELFIQLIDFVHQKNGFSNVPSSDNFIKPLLHIWGLLYSKEELLYLLQNVDTNTPCFKRLMFDAVSQLQIRELLSYYIRVLFKKEDYKLLCALKENIDWAKDEFDFCCYYIAALAVRDFNNAVNVEIYNANSELFVGINLLLLENKKWDVIEKIKVSFPLEENFMDCIKSIYLQEEDDADIFSRIETDFSKNEQIALYKLLSAQTVDNEVKNLLKNRIGKTSSADKFMAGMRSEVRRKKGQVQSKTMEGVSLRQTEDVKHVEMINSEYDFIKDTMHDISFDGVTKKDERVLSKQYTELGSNIRENLEYRKDLLTKLCYITSESEDSSQYTKYAIQLGVVLFYNKGEINYQEARADLYQSISLLTNDTDGITKQFVRDAALEMLVSFDNMKELVDDSVNLNDCLFRMENFLNFSKLSTFFKQLGKILNSLEEAASFTSIVQAEETYNVIKKQLGDYISKGDRQNSKRQEVYFKWYHLVDQELERVKNGAILKLEIETKQCQVGVHGKVCGIIRNAGNKLAEDVRLEIFFDDSVHCKDGKRVIQSIYGQDVQTFAFTIKCQDEGEFKYYIVLSYKVDQEEQKEQFSGEVRVTAQNDFEHIGGDLYSLHPVTTNEEFYGRKLEAEKIFGFLNDTHSNTSMVMYGLKRVGKTSMLRYIERTMMDSDIYIPIYISAQHLGKENSVGHMFVETVIEALEKRALTDEKCDSFRDYNYDVSPEKLYDFYQYLQDADVMKGKRILFMADEIEVIFENVDENCILVNDVTPNFQKIKG